MGCWICQHQVSPTDGDPVGTCSDCWIHACDDHGERPAGGKFQCAVNTAKIAYASLVFAAPSAVPIGAAALGGQQAPDQRDSARAATTIWVLSTAHREFWRRRIDRVLARASADPNSPWYGREVPRDWLALRELADLVGLVAWYLGLEVGQRFPSLSDAHDRSGADGYDYAEPAPVALAWLFARLAITPAEVVYLLRYFYAGVPEVAESDQYWGLGPRLHELMLQYPFGS